MLNSSEIFATRPQIRDGYAINPTANENTMSAATDNGFLDEREARNAHMAQEIKEMFEQKEDGKYPRRINLWFYLWKIRDIKTVSESFTADISIAASWIEDDLENNPFLKTPKDEDIDPAKWEEKNFSWLPNLRFLNLIERDGPRKRVDFFRVDEYNDDEVVKDRPSRTKVRRNEWFAMERSERRAKKWRVTQEMTIKADFSEEMELQGFPFDIQPLHIELTSTRKCKTVILSFEDKERPCSMSPNALESQEFELHSPQLVSYDMSWKDKDKPLLSMAGSSSNGRRYSRAYIVFTVTRKPQYYLWNFYLMLFILGSLTLTIFLEDPSSSNRLGNVLTLLLSLVAFKFVMSQSLPVISYLTMLDGYNIFTLAMMALLAVYVAVFRAFIVNDVLSDELGEKVDFIVGIAFAALWGIINLYFMFYSVGRNLRRIRKVKIINQHFTRYRRNFLGDKITYQYKRYGIHDDEPEKLNYVNPLFGPPKEMTYFEIVKCLFNK